MIIGCKEASQIKSTEGLLDSFTLNMPSCSLNKSNYSLLHGGKQAFPAGETSVPIKGNASFHEGKLPFPAVETDLNIGGVRLKKGLHHLPKRV